MPQGAGRRKNARTESGGVQNEVAIVPRRRPERRSQRQRRSPPDGGRLSANATSPAPTRSPPLTQSPS
eukprot:9200606-Pyramimonas_sp.AAC.1